MEEPRAISSDLIRGHIDTIILNSLIDGDKYAQLISETIESSSDGKYSINQATLYSSLKRLESVGYVTSYWYDAPDGRRKYFEITEKGRENVENNLSNWTYSKTIIDKLIGLSGFVCDNNENTVSNASSAPAISQSFTTAQSAEMELNSINSQFNTVNSAQKATENNFDANPQQNNLQDKNDVVESEINSPNLSPIAAESDNFDFRAVLGGLIEPVKNDKVNNAATEAVENLSLFEANEVVSAENSSNANSPASATTTQEIAGFNDAICANVSHSQIDGSNIDYTDLSIKAAKKGYKIRFSSKNSAKTDGKLYINKLNFAAIFYTFLLAALQCVTFLLFFDKKFVIPTSLKIIGVIVLVALPIISGIIYRKNPKKTSNKNITADSILTAGIIVFNLLLLTFASGLLLNLDYTNKYNLLYAVVVPVHICFDILVFSIVRFFIAKKPKYNVKSNVNN